MLFCNQSCQTCSWNKETQTSTAIRSYQTHCIQESRCRIATVTKNKCETLLAWVDHHMKACIKKATPRADVTIQNVCNAFCHNLTDTIVQNMLAYIMDAGWIGRGEEPYISTICFKLSPACININCMQVHAIIRVMISIHTSFWNLNFMFKNLNMVCWNRNISTFNFRGFWQLETHLDNLAYLLLWPCDPLIGVEGGADTDCTSPRP